MALRIISADERLSAAENKTSFAIFGPPGIGKTTLLKTLPEHDTVCLDLEAGLKSVQDWRGASIPVRSFGDFRDLAVLIGGADPAQDAASWYSAVALRACPRRTTRDSGLEAFLATKSIVFVDSITDLTRQAMLYAKQQPEAVSERSGKPDVRGAYGLLGREVIQALKHLQHAPGKTVIFVGVLEKVTDEFNAVTWQPQMEGSKAARELPGIVDQVLSMHLFGRDANGGYVLDDKATERRLVCKAGNPYGLPAKDRSGRLDMTEPPDLGQLLAKINAATARARPLTPSNRTTPMYDLNDAQPQMAPVGELIPDGTFARVALTLRPGGLNGGTPADAGLLKASNAERREASRLRVHRGRGPVRPAEVLAELHRRRRQGRREGPVEGLEHRQERLPGDDRQRARAEPEGRERRGEGEAGHPGSEAARRHHLRRPDHGRAGVERPTTRRRTSSPTW